MKRELEYEKMRSFQRSVVNSKELEDSLLKRYNNKEKENKKYESDLDKEKTKKNKKIRFAEIKRRILKERNKEKLIEKISQMESYLYKAYIKQYEIDLAQEDYQESLFDQKKTNFA